MCKNLINCAAKLGAPAVATARDWLSPEVFGSQVFRTLFAAFVLSAYLAVASNTSLAQMTNMPVNCPKVPAVKSIAEQNGINGLTWTSTGVSPGSIGKWTGEKLESKDIVVFEEGDWGSQTRVFKVALFGYAEFYKCNAGQWVLYYFPTQAQAQYTTTILRSALQLPSSYLDPKTGKKNSWTGTYRHVVNELFNLNSPYRADHRSDGPWLSTKLNVDLNQSDTIFPQESGRIAKVTANLTHLWDKKGESGTERMQVDVDDLSEQPKYNRFLICEGSRSGPLPTQNRAGTMPGVFVAAMTDFEYPLQVLPATLESFNSGERSSSVKAYENDGNFDKMACWGMDSTTQYTIFDNPIKEESIPVEYTKEDARGLEYSSQGKSEVAHIERRSFEQYKGIDPYPVINSLEEFHGGRNQDGNVADWSEKTKFKRPLLVSDNDPSTPGENEYDDYEFKFNNHQTGDTLEVDQKETGPYLLGDGDRSLGEEHGYYCTDGNKINQLTIPYRSVSVDLTNVYFLNSRSTPYLDRIDPYFRGVAETAEKVNEWILPAFNYCKEKENTPAIPVGPFEVPAHEPKEGIHDQVEEAIAKGFDYIMSSR